MRAAELAAERTRYDVGRAEREFLACEPENQRAARTLEARWEARLADLADTEAALAAQPQPSGHSSMKGSASAFGEIVAVASN